MGRTPDGHAVAVAADLLACRRTLQALHGDRYAARVQPWKEVLYAVSQLPPGRSVLAAALEAAQRSDDPIGTRWLLAAAVEILEDRARPH